MPSCFRTSAPRGRTLEVAIRSMPSSIRHRARTFEQGPPLLSEALGHRVVARTTMSQVAGHCFHREAGMAWKTMTGESSDPADAAKMMRDVMGPQAVDQFIRQAVSTCWMMLPEEDKTVEALEREVRRLVDRALKDVK